MARRAAASKSIVCAFAPAVNDRPDAARPVNRPEERREERHRNVVLQNYD